MAYQNLLIIFVFLLLYSLYSKRLDKTILSGPFLALMVGVVFGPELLNLFNTGVEAEDYRIIAELALALVLFGDASKTNLAVLRKSAVIPTRLLLIGLPLTIILGVLGGFLVFVDFTWIEMGILATMLAPTDAALGKAVVSNKAVPVKIREALNIESGLNDGISVPVLFIFIALFDSLSGDTLESFYGLTLLAREIGLGLLAGLTITYVFVKIAVHSIKREGVSESWQQVMLIALALTCFVVAQIIGGSGFIACFAAGFLFGTLCHKYNLNFRLVDPLEGAGDSMSLVTWILFGSIILALGSQFTWQVVVYSVLSLTMIRMIPVWLSLSTTSLNRKEKLFIGWFGPRGLATVVFAIIVLDVQLPHKDLIILTAACTVLLSVILHGLTPKPFIHILNKR